MREKQLSLPDWLKEKAADKKNNRVAKPKAGLGSI